MWRAVNCILSNIILMWFHSIIYRTAYFQTSILIQITIYLIFYFTSEKYQNDYLLQLPVGGTPKRITQNCLCYGRPGQRFVSC